MKKIYLFHRRKLTNVYAMVDNEDYFVLRNMKWRMHKSYTTNCFYAVTSVGESSIAMHLFIVNAPKGFEVDHKDGNGLNNQKINLRACTHQQNGSNLRKNKKNTTGFKGVHFNTSRNTFQSYITPNRKHIYLGSYKTDQEAALAYDEAAIEHFGEFACTNRKLGLLDALAHPLS